MFASFGLACYRWLLRSLYSGASTGDFLPPQTTESLLVMWLVIFSTFLRAQISALCFLISHPPFVAGNEFIFIITFDEADNLLFLP